MFFSSGVFDRLTYVSRERRAAEQRESKCQWSMVFNFFFLNLMVSEVVSSEGNYVFYSVGIWQGRGR